MLKDMEFRLKHWVDLRGNQFGVKLGGRAYQMQSCCLDGCKYVHMPDLNDAKVRQKTKRQRDQVITIWLINITCGGCTYQHTGRD
jgi:hypothetical protein